MNAGRDHRHQFGDWFNSGTCQRRSCECGQTETRDHSWGPWSLSHARGGQVRGGPPGAGTTYVFARTCQHCSKVDQEERS